MISIRRATIDDAVRVAPLFDAYRQFYRKPADPDLALRFVTERLQYEQSILLIAEDAAARITGFCQLYPSFCSVAAAPIAVLYDLFVDPPARACGVGRALMRAAHAQAAQTGAVRLDLSTAKSNMAAQALYESLGWVRDDLFWVYNKAVAASQSLDGQAGA